MNLRYFSILPLFFLLHVNAQKMNGNLYVSITPTLANSFNTYTSDPGNAYKDSIRKMDRWRKSVGASVLYGVKLRKTTKLLFGLQYNNFGFTRRKEDYKFLDTLHPDIGIMSDMSQTGGNYIDFRYRYQYISIPVLYSTQISGRSMKNTTIHWTIGGSVATLVNHDIKAILNGFTTKGKDEFKLSGEKDVPSRLNVNFQTGFRLENLIDRKGTFVFVQPTLFVPVFSANSGKERHHLYSFACEIGFIFKLQSDDKQK